MADFFNRVAALNIDGKIFRYDLANDERFQIISLFLIEESGLKLTRFSDEAALLIISLFLIEESGLKPFSHPSSSSNAFDFSLLN